MLSSRTPFVNTRNHYEMRARAPTKRGQGTHLVARQGLLKQKDVNAICRLRHELISAVTKAQASEFGLVRLVLVHASAEMQSQCIGKRSQWIRGA